MDRELGLLLNSVVNRLLKLGKVTLIYSQNSCVKIKIGRNSIIVKANDLKLDHKPQQQHIKSVYREYHPVNDRQVLSFLNSVFFKTITIKDFPDFFKSFKNISSELERIRRRINKDRKKTIHIREPKVKGKIHFRHKTKKKLRLYVSSYHVNQRCAYEQLLVRDLSSKWKMGTLFTNFCVIEATLHGVRLLFELDAVSFLDDNIFIFEIKNKTLNNAPSHELQRMLQAAKLLNVWRRKMDTNLRKIYPILYFREANHDDFELFNKICYSNLSNTKCFDISRMVSYRLPS